MMRRRTFLLGAAHAAWTSRLVVAAKPVRARIVIAGGGFAGSACALELRRLAPQLDIVLVDPDERYVTCPMSNEALVGLRTMASLTVTRAGLARAGVRYARARVRGIDAQRRCVRLDDGAELGFDRLVVALGIRFLCDRIEGYTEGAAQRLPHAWRAGAQTELLAAQLRAMPDGGVVAISVPPGLMRCPPGPYERASLIAHFLAAHKPRAKVLIFDANNHFPKQDVFLAAWQALYPRLIEWIPLTEGGAVTRVDVDKCTLYTSSGAHRVAVANLIPPQGPGQLAPDLGLASEHGWCPIKPASFESTRIDHVHVLGDACIAGAMPKSAAAAVSQARQCARAIVAALSGRDAPAPQLESVCYSALTPQRALAIRARFDLNDGMIEQRASASVDASAAALDQRAAHREAQAWYRGIVADSFGASDSR
jgi:sulfide dehydrogenase [flavocytochrome c] flavoprotein subunit